MSIETMDYCKTELEFYQKAMDRAITDNDIEYMEYCQEKIDYFSKKIENLDKYLSKSR